MEEAAQVTGSQRRLVPDTLFSSTRPPHAPPAVPVTCCAAVTHACAMPVDSPGLPGSTEIAQTVLIILTMVGLFPTILYIYI